MDEHERLLAIEEELLQALGIPYRVVNIAVDDLGGSAAKKYDCEAWMPGQGRYREVTSTSNTTDFQARRLDIRYRPAEGGKPRHVHTLNGTAVTWRHLIALLENGQHEDGVVAVPDVLQAWGAPAVLRVGDGAMSETPITPDDPDIPDEPPPAGRRSARGRGPAARPARRHATAEDAPLPGLPEREPPAAD